MQEIKREFIGNTVLVDVDGLKGINTYTVKACYEVTYRDERGEFAKTEFKEVDSFSLTWDEIEEDGGITQVSRDLAEAYGPDPFKK